MLINGQKFHHLTVIQTGIKNSQNRLMVKCKCDCGNVKLVRQSDLLSGHTKTCGCEIKNKKKSKKGAKTTIILSVGQRFGKLVIVNNTEIVYNGQPHMIRCKCDCGNEVYVCKYDLIHKYRTQCGKCKKMNLLKEGYRQGHLVITKKIDEDNFEVQCDCGNTILATRKKLYTSYSCGQSGCFYKKEKLAKIKQQRAKDEVGNKYGELTVISEAPLEEQIKTTRTLVKCKCSCGNILVSELRRLKDGIKKSCGCLYRKSNKENSKKAVEKFKEKAKEKRMETIQSCIGKKFNKLTVLEVINPMAKNAKDILVKVKCDCGNITEKNLYSVRKEKTKSCGCLPKGRPKKVR